MITAAPPINQTSDIALPNIILTGGSSALSIVGALVIFCSYSFIPPEKNFTRKLLMYLTVADFVTAFGNMVGMVRYVTLYGTGPRVQNCSGHVKTEEEWLCKTQSFLTTASNMSSFLWTLVIAVHLWASVVLQSDKTKSRLARFIYHVLCWAVPVAVVASIFGSLGEDYCFGTGVWCGIRSDLPHHEVEMLMYIADIAWQLFSYIASCFLLVFIIFYLRMKRLNIGEVRPFLRGEDRNYLYIWFVLYSLKLWGIIRFFLTTYMPADKLNTRHMKTFLKVLLYLQSYGASGQAFWNCVVFCLLDRTVRIGFKNKLFGCKAETRPLLHEDSDKLFCCNPCIQTYPDDQYNVSRDSDR